MQVKTLGVAALRGHEINTNPNQIKWQKKRWGLARVSQTQDLGHAWCAPKSMVDIEFAKVCHANKNENFLWVVLIENGFIFCHTLRILRAGNCLLTWSWNQYESRPKGVALMSVKPRTWCTSWSWSKPSPKDFENAKDTTRSHVWDLVAFLTMNEAISQNLRVGGVPNYEQNHFPEPGTWVRSYIWI